MYIFNDSPIKGVLNFMFVCQLSVLGHCCDLEQFFSEKQVSVEESTVSSPVVFRGITVADAAAAAALQAGPTQLPPTANAENDVHGGVFTTYFELINTYKGVEVLNSRVTNNFRRLNVSIASHPSIKCDEGSEVLREYIIFCELVNDELLATSVAIWDEETDQRVWTSLGWNKWSEWSACSVSCSSGIQQRTRHCRSSKCPGFNVEQRHCNLFGCDEAANPLALEGGRFFHPSKDRWVAVPDRATAWRLKPNSYIWVPSTQLFSTGKVGQFPREFALFITLRLHNDTMGTIFSLRSHRRQNTYLSLEVAGSDLKLIHAAANGTDVVRIPAQLNDGHWHQVALSIRDGSVVNSYVECEWSRTDVLKSHTLDIPDDADLIIGYLFSGDLEQLTVVKDPKLVNLHCSMSRTPIIDANVEKSTAVVGKKKNAKNDEPHIVIKRPRRVFRRKEIQIDNSF